MLDKNRHTPTSENIELVTHTSVLLQETIDGLDIQSDDVVFDGTLGAGGHSYEIAQLYPAIKMIIGTDLDPDALLRTEQKLASTFVKTYFTETNFRDIASVIEQAGETGVDKILLDLGVSTFTFFDSERGFSFKKDEPLLMTFGDPEKSIVTAEQVVNDWDEESLETIFSGYGEERRSKLLARKIVQARQQARITTSLELATIVEKALGKKGKIHPATKIFQAIRIAVNDELGALQQVLSDGWSLLRPGGRMAIISFHSLEDRIVKRYFKELAQSENARLITKHPIVPTDNEVRDNKKARSAKLRIIEKSNTTTYNEKKLN